MAAERAKSSSHGFASTKQQNRQHFSTRTVVTRRSSPLLLILLMCLNNTGQRSYDPPLPQRQHELSFCPCRLADRRPTPQLHSLQSPRLTPPAPPGSIPCLAATLPTTQPVIFFCSGCPATQPILAEGHFGPLHITPRHVRSPFWVFWPPGLLCWVPFSK